MVRHASGLTVGLFLGLLSFGSAACDDSKKTGAAPEGSSPPRPPGVTSASSAAASASAAPAATLTKFAVDASSKTSISLEAPKEAIKAATTGGTGTLELDLTNLRSSRGEVKMDLSTIVTSSFEDAKRNASQTTHARTWLEVGDGEDEKLDEKTKAKNRWAVYAIRAVDQVSEPDVTKVAPTKDGADEVRTVTLTTKGDLTIHGHKVERSAELEAALRYDPGAPADKPKAVWVKSKKPFRVVLAEHDVKPRDGFGKIAKGSFHLLGTKVADNADITLDIRAKAE